MVSTRSVKGTKFSEGEKVLCYEPDPAKTKVLYNSKVLEIDQKKDEQGRNVVHFLIHFQGWNSTWDRFVTEDYILKDTEENRRLQRELAEKAHLTPGGNLYRRGRKKRTLSRTGGGGGGGGGSDSERGGGGGGGRMTVGGGGETDSEEGETEHRGGGGGSGGGQTNFSPRLQSILELDNLLITKQNKLHKLPASPNAVEILELYMKDFTINQIKLMCHRRGHLRPTAGKNAHVTVHDITSRANLCREIADGLRVYLDFMTEAALLYRGERAQYRELTASLPPHHSAAAPSSPLSSAAVKQFNSFESGHHSSKRKEEEVTDYREDSDKHGKDSDRRKSLRSHTDLASVSATPASSSSSSQPPGGGGGGSSLPAGGGGGSLEGKGGAKNQAAPSELGSSSSTKMTPAAPAPEQPLQGQIDLATLLGQDVVKGGEHLILRPLTQKERDHLKRLVNRKVVNESFYRSPCTETSSPPCLIYGATHLARALVKIPDIFPHAEHSESKMIIIHEYLNGFTKFLEEHPEWFGEQVYTDNTYPQEVIKEENLSESK